MVAGFSTENRFRQILRPFLPVPAKACGLALS